jgi:hypothetical protein
VHGGGGAEMGGGEGTGWGRKKGKVAEKRGRMGRVCVSMGRVD